MISLGILIFVGSNKVYAGHITTFNPNPVPGTDIPASVKNSLISGCGHTNQSPGFALWMSPTGANAQTSTSVSYGAPSIDLSFHFGGLICYPNSAVPQTRAVNVGRSASPAGSVSVLSSGPPYINILDFNTNYQNVGYWRRSELRLRYAPTGGFTTSGVYTIVLDEKIVNQFTGNTYGCTDPANPRRINSWFEFNLCPTTRLTFNIYVSVGPAPFNYGINLRLDNPHSPTLGSTSGCLNVRPNSLLRFRSNVWNAGTARGEPYYHRISHTNNNTTLPRNDSKYTAIESPYIVDGSNFSTGGLYQANDSIYWQPTTGLNAGSSRDRFGDFRTTSNAPNGTRIYFGAVVNPRNANGDRNYSSKICINIYNPPPVPTPPICSNTTIDRYVNIGIGIGTTLTNRHSSAITINSVNYSGSGKSGSVSPGGSLAAGSNRNYAVNIGSFSSAGTYTINWNIQTSAGPATCSVTINVTAPLNNPPTCVDKLFTGYIGTTVNINTDLTNNHTSAISIDTGGYWDGGLIGGVISDLGGNLNANESRNYNADIGPIFSPGTYDIWWFFTTSEGNANCKSTIILSVPTADQPIVCSAPTISVSPGEAFQLTLSIRNEDNPPASSPVELSNIEWEILGRENGNGSPDYIILNAGDVISTDSDRNDLIIDLPGIYDYQWTFDINDEALRPTAYPCSGKINVARLPYARFYGNEVIAGGGIGESCSLPSTSALGSGTGNNHANYRGTAAELAVYAGGLIKGVLPGSQLVRSNTLELSFSNLTNIDPDSQGFGGGFGAFNCLPGYPAIGGTNWTDSNFNNLNGDYYFNGDKYVNGNSTILSGKRAKVVIDGDLIIDKNVNLASSNWGQIEDIPILIVYVEGNIYINHEVKELYGIYFAKDDGSGTEGNIYTCTDGDDNYALTDADYITDCNEKLTVYGSLNANQVHFQRTVGNISDSSPQEGTSGNQAESIIFTPDLYMALHEKFGETSSSINTFEELLSLPAAY